MNKINKNKSLKRKFKKRKMRLILIKYDSVYFMINWLYLDKKNQLNQFSNYLIICIYLTICYVLIA
jgi:alkyl hydroperoxide reductase subunit AhpC